MRRTVILIALVVAGGAAYAAALRPAGPATADGIPQTPAATSPGPRLDDVERRLGPFLIGPYTLPLQAVTVVEHYARVPERPSRDPDAEALARLEIIDASGTVRHQESFDHALDGGTFANSCSASVEPLKGNVASGLLLSSGCVPSAPDAADLREIFGAVNGRVQMFGRPFLVRGELVGLVQTPVVQTGAARLIRPDTLRFKVRTSNFSVMTAINVDWMQGTLSLSQRCYGQTGQGLREEGCEVPVDAERVPGDQSETFVRLFTDATEQAGLPRHIVVRQTSVVTFLAAKVRVVWDESSDVADLHVDEDDMWLKLRIDGQEGWIHTQEDFLAIGLPAIG